ncbi:nucleotidyltransferase domain-containing protein [Acidaminobacter sp. JC074]|uniref:nucleotidyltransferase domain-containing protein n=1 Tax=Acidaminobacter sp. JC074 TaxID=2530199 RepID=UPI001F0CFE4E|nr:nucleotidyltransferase domain-containing protein [Acidaminobacter sp. JC074]
MNEIILEYINTLDVKSYKGIGLVGSYASGHEKIWSDIDLVFLVEEDKSSQIILFKDKYFTLTYYTEEGLDNYLCDVKLMIRGVSSFKEMKILYDPEQVLEAFKNNCLSHVPTSVDKEHSLYASKNEYIGYIEEAQKALQGLLDNHHGKMLCGLYGLTYGMFQVLVLKNHLYTSSDNDFYDVVMNHLDDKNPIKDLAPQAFGIVQTNLEDQVEAGLEMFMHVGNSLMKVFSDDEKHYVMKLMHEIIREV